MTPLLVLVAGKDPLAETADGHCHYVCAHARAALRAGYEPEIVCFGRPAGSVETDFGTVRKIATRVGPTRQLMIPLLGPPLVREIVSRGREAGGPVLVHGFGVWSWAGVRACERLRAGGVAATAIASSYTTYLTEAYSQASGVVDRPLRTRLDARAKVLWVRAVAERYERVGYRDAERVFVNYDSVRRMIHDRHGPDVEVRRLPYTPESGFLPPGAPGPVPAPVTGLQPAGAPLVLSMSSHHPRKGVDVLIDALALARDRGTPLRACLLSSGPLTEHHRRRVAERGLERSVAMPGRVEDTEPYMRAADIYVLPSRAEQSGALSLLEAMRAGLPPIASAVDGVPEDVEHEDSALLVAPGDPAALADALVRLASDASLRERIGRGARRTFEERFSADRFAEALGAAYSELGFEPDRARIPKGVAV